jgi:hypothetical protein
MCRRTSRGDRGRRLDDAVLELGAGAVGEREGDDVLRRDAVAALDSQDLGNPLRHHLDEKAPISGAFAEPSDGLEPSTPSL